MYIISFLFLSLFLLLLLITPYLFQTTSGPYEIEPFCNVFLCKTLHIDVSIPITRPPLPVHVVIYVLMIFTGINCTNFLESRSALGGLSPPNLLMSPRIKKPRCKVSPLSWGRIEQVFVFIVFGWIVRTRFWLRRFRRPFQKKKF